MYRVVEKTLLKEFVDSNYLLYRVFIVLAIFIQPILLLFGPIPGYLFYTSDVTSLPFWISLFFLGACSYVSATIYDTITNAKYFNWIILLAGRKHFFRGYCLGQARFAIPTIALLVFGLFKVDDLYTAASRLMAIILVHVLFYVYRGKDVLASKKKIKFKSPYTHLGLNLIKPVIFHLIAYSVVCSGYLLLFLVDNYSVKVVYTAIITGFIVLIVAATYRIVRQQIKKHSVFLKLVDIALYRNTSLVSYGLLFTMLSLPTAFLILLLVR